MRKIVSECGIVERIFVKYTTTSSRGVEPITLSRNAIGYLVSGEKYIHDGDKIKVISQGDIFILQQGIHYIEDIPAVDEPFEQIIFYYTASQIQHIITKMNIEDIAFDWSDGNTTVRVVSLPKERPNASRGVVSAAPSPIVSNFLSSTIRHYEYGGFHHNTESERIRLMELVYLILSHEGGDMQHAIMRSLDSDRADFEKVIYDNLFRDLSVDELAGECNRSLTAFKKEFKRIFAMPPHQWYMAQRLCYAKLLLMTTTKSISQVGNESAFPNTSHFIKLFKRYYGVTPANFRSRQKQVEPISSLDLILER